MRPWPQQRPHARIRAGSPRIYQQLTAGQSRQLSWSHFVELTPIDDPLKRDSYAEMCRVERWSVRTLRHKISHLLFERTAVSKKSADLIEQNISTLRDEDRLTPDMVFRDPYFLDFLGLSDQHVEKDVEAAILRELQAFILELGSDFAFVARQKRITNLCACSVPRAKAVGTWVESRSSITLPTGAGSDV